MSIKTTQGLVVRVWAGDTEGEWTQLEVHKRIFVTENFPKEAESYRLEMVKMFPPPTYRVTVTAYFADGRPEQSVPEFLKQAGAMK